MNFRCSLVLRKYFNNEFFPNYGVSELMPSLVASMLRHFTHGLTHHKKAKLKMKKDLEWPVMLEKPRNKGNATTHAQSHPIQPLSLTQSQKSTS